MSRRAGPPMEEWQVAVHDHDELGEGPAWDVATATLLRVDVRGRLVRALEPATGRSLSWGVPSMASAVVPRERGGVVLALEDGAWAADAWGGPLRLLAPLEGDPTMRSNDAKCDRRGRLWVGSMAHDERRGAGSLYRVEAGRAAVPVLDRLTISNGIGWSPDDRLMYFVDSAERRLDVLDYDLASGTATGRRPLVELPPGAGFPDGLTVDAEGFVWLALWDGWAVRRYAPDGRLDRVVALPVARPTSCTFGGPDLADLYVTSARDRLSPADLVAQPLAGALFVLRPGVVGQPMAAFAG